MHAFTKFKFAKRVFLLLSGKIGISYKVKKKGADPPAPLWFFLPVQLARVCKHPIVHD